MWLRQEAGVAEKNLAKPALKISFVMKDGENYVDNVDNVNVKIFRKGRKGRKPLRVQGIEE